ncbi:MAG: hypothetical protein QXO35_02380 [Candidatus Micrarchaeia archaeon]
MNHSNRFSFFPLSFILIISLIPLIFAGYPIISQSQREAVPINESLRSVEGVYSVFPFVDCSLIPNRYGGFGHCNDFVADFCIDKQLDLSRSIIPLNSEEKNEMRSILAKLKSADDSIIAMKNKLFSSLVKKNCTYENLILSSQLKHVLSLNGISLVFDYLFYKYFKTNPINFYDYSLRVTYSCEGIEVPIVSDLIDILVDFVISFDRYLEYQTSAYQNAAEALNSLFDLVIKQADSLYYEGAGYSNYSTSAYKFYNERIKSFIYKSNQNQIEPTQSDLNSRDFSSYFIYVRNISKKVSSERVNKLSNCEIAVMSSPQYIIAFNYLIDLYREIQEARATLRSDYDVAKSEATQKFIDAQTRYNILMNEKYWLVNQPIVAYALNSSQETTMQEGLIVPSDSLMQMKELLYGSGSSISVKNLLDAANKDTDDQVIFYYSKGIEKFRKATELSKFAINNSYKIEVESDNVLISLNEKVRYKLEYAHNNLTKYPVYDIASASAYELLNNKYHAAASIYNNYNPSNTTKGERIVQLYNAALMLDEVISFASIKSSDIIELKKKSFKEALDELNATIKKAQMDEIDITAELQLLNSKTLLLGMNVNNVSFLEDSLNALIQAKEAIYSKAELMYSDLPSLRARIYSIINSISPYMNTNQYRTTIDQIDRIYFIDGSFNPNRCLGNYKSIKNNYSAVLEELNKNAASLLSTYLSNKYSAKTLFDTTPQVDSYTNITTYLEIKNDLSLSTNSQVVVQVRGIPYEVNSIIESEIPGIYAIKNKDYVSIYFPTINKTTNYLLKIKSYIKPSTLVSKKTERLVLTNERLTEKITYEIDSIYDIDSLILTDNYWADECSVFMNNRMQTIRSYSNLSILLSNVKTGKQSIYATCTKNNPITYSASGFTSSDNKISYTLQIKSNYEDLNDVDYVLEIMGSADEIQSDSIRVYDSKGQITKNFQFYRSGDKYYAKWFIPILSSEYQNYTVSYVTTDIVSYYSKLKSEIENISTSESIDVSSYIRDATYRASRGKYDEAINSLDKAKKEISQIRTQRSENLSLTERLDKLNNKILQLKNKSNEIYSIAINLSLSDINVEVARQIAEFEADSQLARNYLAKGDIANAKSLISKLEKLVSSTKIDNSIYAKEKKLLDSLIQAERKVVSIGKFTDISSQVERLNKIKSSISLVEPATAVQDYYTALINLNNAFNLINEINSDIENSSIQINAQLEAKLKISKEVLNKWKNNNKIIVNAFSIDKNSPIKSIPESIEILNKINITDSLVNELNILYSKLNGYKLDERIINIAEFEELDSKTDKIQKDIEYYEKLVDQYKSASNEIIKDAGLIFEEKLNKGSANEKKKVVDLQPILSYAKELHSAGMYLNSIMLTQYARNELISIPSNEATIDLTLLVYFGIVIIAIAIILKIISRKEPPKIERKIEKIKLD